MRSIIYSLLSLATLTTALAIESNTPRATTAADDDDWDDKLPDTIFNGQNVPPMTELGQDIDKEITKGNWYVCCDIHQYGTLTHNLQASRVLLTRLPSLHALQAHISDRI